MNSRLNRISDWASLAHLAQYSCVVVAGLCRVSLRQLQRYCFDIHGKAPKKWLQDLRLKKAVVMLSEGKAVKEVAFDLYYKTASHFIRDFKQYYGVTPGQWMQKGAASCPSIAPNDIEVGNNSKIGLAVRAGSLMVAIANFQLLIWEFMLAA